MNNNNVKHGDFIVPLLQHFHKYKNTQGHRIHLQPLLLTCNLLIHMVFSQMIL